MNKFWTVLGHTYLSKLKSKSFIITTIIVLFVMVIASNLEHIIDLFAGEDDSDEVIVIDHSEEAYPLLDSGEITYIAYDESEKTGKQAVEQEEYEGLVVIEKDAANTIRSVLYENEASSFLKETVENDLQQVKIALATQEAGVDAAQLDSIYSPMPLEHVALDETAKTEEELSSTRGIIYVMLFVLYMTVLLYGQMIATEVATEKSSRVMEILISSASPVTHMFAKILGVGLLGLTQILVFIGIGYTLIAGKVREYAGGFFDVFGFSSTSVSIYVYAVIFFLLGYFLYATISAMLGSLVSKVEDVQQLMLPIIFLVMIAFFIAIFGLGSPDATFIKITSFIPFFSPMIMFLRVGMLDVPVWQIALSIGILLGTIYLLAVIGARVYRGGVLLYGSSKSLKDLGRAFQLSKKE